MATPYSDLGPGIDSAAGSPRRAEVDGLSAEAQPLSEQIAADKYLSAKGARALPGRGIMRTKLIGPAQCPANGTSTQADQFGADGSFG
jgi:hypothetical protein